MNKFDKSDELEEDTTFFKTRTMPYCDELLISLIPDSCLVCCKKSRKIVAMEKAREML